MPISDACVESPQYICEYFVEIQCPPHIKRENICFYFAMICSSMCLSCVYFFFFNFFIWFGLLSAECDVKERKHRIQAHSWIYGKSKRNEHTCIVVSASSVCALFDYSLIIFVSIHSMSLDICYSTNTCNASSQLYTIHTHV